MLAWYARSLGMRVALVSATRGDGGQNEIGPELFDALGVLRTEELLAAHQYRRRRAVLHPGGGLRLLVQPGGNAREVGQGRDSRRLRPAHPDPAARRHRHARRRRHGRRPASPDLGGDRRRSLQGRRRPGPVPRADQGRPEAVAGEEAVSHRRWDRRAWPWRSGRAWRTGWRRARPGRTRAGCTACSRSRRASCPRRGAGRSERAFRDD